MHPEIDGVLKEINDPESKFNQWQRANASDLKQRAEVHFRAGMSAMRASAKLFADSGLSPAGEATQKCPVCHSPLNQSN